MPSKYLLLSAAISCFALPAKAETKENEIFMYQQVMANCIGQQYLDQTTERMVSAIRRCEQIRTQPLRDRALETVINNLQGEGRQVVYVPVAVGNTGGNFPLNSLGGGGFSPSLNPTLNPALNPTFSNPGLLGLGGLNNNNNLGFNRIDSNLDRRRPSTTFGSTVSTTTNTRNNNPFGFNFGKQTSEDAAIKLVGDNAEKSLLKEGEASVAREKRQITNDARTRIEALNYLSNMTCVMREAGVIDHNNLPNYQFFENELRRLQVGRDLRNDLANGLFFCKDLTQCMSVDRLNHPLARELGQAIAYMRCIARTNVKACKKQEDRRSQGNARLTGAFNFFNGNGMDLLNSVQELAFSDDFLGFEFF